MGSLGPCFLLLAQAICHAKITETTHHVVHLASLSIGSLVLTEFVDQHSHSHQHTFRAGVTFDQGLIGTFRPGSLLCKMLYIPR